jgi:Winged helix-turn-helix DNA-binding
LPDYVDTARRAIDEQLASLRKEIERLEAAAAALGGARRGRRRGPGRPRGSGTATGTGRRRGRRRGTGTRAAQAEKLVRENPGITIRELADKMGIKQNYLYRVMPQLEADKKVRKRNQGWHPA